MNINHTARLISCIPANNPITTLFSSHPLSGTICNLSLPKQNPIYQHQNKQDKKKSPINPSKSNRRRKNNPIQSVWTLIVSDRRISLLPQPRDLSANHSGLGTCNGAHPESDTRNSLWIMQRRLVHKGYYKNTYYKKRAKFFACK